MKDSISSGTGTKEALDKLLSRAPNIIDEGLTFKERLEQPISYRYLWTFNKIEEWRIKQGKESKDIFILDVGSWTGMMSYLLNKAGYRVTALDSNKEYLDIIKEHSTEVNTMEGDIMNIPEIISSKYDIVIALEVIEHLTPDKEAIQRIYSVVAENGLLIATTPIEKNLLCKEHVNFYDFYQIMELFDIITDDYKICRLHKFDKNRTPNIWGIIVNKGE